MFRARFHARARLRHRSLFGAVPLLVFGLLAGCSGMPGPEEPVVSSAPVASTDTPADAPSTEGQDGAGDTAAPGSGGEVSAQLQPDGSILVDADNASFLMPSQNVACVVRPDNAVCQIDGKEYDARAADIDPAAFEGCTPAEADAMSVGGGTDPRWSCLPYDLRPGTEVTSGGAWSGPGLGATQELAGATVAVLPYDTTLRLGNISCTSDRQGVRCTDLTTGHGFQLARERYTTH